MKISNKYFNGKNGKVWVNDKTYTNCHSLTTTIAIEHEEIIDPREGKFGKTQIYNGWSGSGSMTIRRDGTEKELINALVDGLNNGNMPDISIIAKMTNNDGSESIRYKYMDITFESFDVQAFEHGTAITELELPFKFGDMKRL